MLSYTEQSLKELVVYDSLLQLMKQKPSVKTEPSELQTIFWQKMLFVGTIVLCFFPTSSRMVHILLKTDCGGKDTLAKFPQSAFMCVFFRFGFLSTAPLRPGARL